jgi:molybdopterin-containing oxidoreductase family membrane subunit
MTMLENITATLPDNTAEDPRRRPDLVLGESGYGSVTARVCGVNEARTGMAWMLGFGLAFFLLGILGSMVLYLILTGVGVWNLNQPVAWAFDITNFVFWIGIGHAGTLISAILFLFRQHWRTGINRFAEAMTIFAVMCAGLFPGIHIGRAWVVYWIFPYPNQMGMWPNFRSPLLWDVFAVSTYASVSMLFWYLGMIPDLASLRDRAPTRRKQIAYGIASLGWRGSAVHWSRYETAYLLLAALATPLVLSVHSVVSFDFATSLLPGWHSTIFPPYFVAGAIYGGFAMVLLLAVPARQWLGLEGLITMRHIENMNKIMLATGLMVSFAYLVEAFTAWYSANPFEQFAFLNRMFGPFAWAFWTMIACNVVIPQVLWMRKARTSLAVTWIVALAVTVGMWFERFVIIVASLSRDYLPSSWGHYSPSWVELLTLLGSFGLFFTCFLLFIRFLPVVAAAEIKAVMAQAHTHHAPTPEHAENP